MAISISFFDEKNIAFGISDISIGECEVIIIWNITFGKNLAKDDKSIFKIFVAIPDVIECPAHPIIV